jgi:hypothetical protein
MKNSILLALFVTLGVAASLQAQDETYAWTEGAPGYSGTIVLDTNASSAGTLADIVSINITTPGGSATLTQANIGDVYINNFDGPFTWNPSQITGMWIDWNTSGGQAGVGENYQPSIPGYNFVFYPGSSVIDLAGPLETDQTGAWRVSPVPEPSVLGLLALGTAAVLVRRRKLIA